MATKKLTVDAFVVVGEAYLGRYARKGWEAKGLGMSMPPTAWRDAAEALDHRQGDGQELARRNPDWHGLPCKVTITFEVPEKGTPGLGAKLLQERDSRG